MSVPVPPATPTLLDRGRDRAQQALAWADETVLGRLWQRLLEVEFVDRSIALAAKAFVSLFPLLLVVTAVSPDVVRTGILTAMETRLGLADASLELVRGAFAGADQIRSSTGVLGLVLTFLYAVSFATAVQRAYLRAWRRPPRGGIQDKRRGLVWIAGVLALLGLVGTLSRAVIGIPGTVLSIVVGVGASTLLWWWTAHTMLRGHLRWRPLLPTALVTGVGAGVYAALSHLWMPTVLATNVSQFGFVGVALALVTWLVGFSFVIVLGAVVGPSLAEGDDVAARWLRGPHDEVLVPGAPAALPGPASPTRLRDALRRERSTAELTET